MLVCINDKEIEIPEHTTVEEVLTMLGFTTRVAVWVNNAQLLQKEYAGRQLAPSDRVRIIKPLGGG